MHVCVIGNRHLVNHKPKRGEEVVNNGLTGSSLFERVDCIILS